MTDGHDKKASIVYLAVSSDVLHPGILNIIDEAKKHGRVVVGVMSDEAIATYKRTPLMDTQARVRQYESLRDVDEVIVQDSLSYKSVLDELRPDFVIHGDDWAEGPQSAIRQEVIEEMEKSGGKLIEVPYTKGVSATGLDATLKALYGSPDSRRGSLRKLLRLKPYLRFIEASNGLAGLIVENAAEADPETGDVKTFDGMWISSLCDSAFKGKPDIELVDFTSRLNTIEEVMEVTTKPIILDGDTGGKIEHFTHNVRTLERVGVSAIIIEDKTGLKQNSLFGTSVPQVQDDPHLFAEKIAAGKRAQRTKEFMIFARIESLIAGAGMEDALKRARIYIEEGGADGIMIHSKERDGEEIFAFLDVFKAEWPDVPVILVPTSFNGFTEEELAARGANIIIHANHMLRAAYMAMKDVSETILRNGRSLEADEVCLPIADVIRLIPEE